MRTPTTAPDPDRRGDREPLDFVIGVRLSADDRAALERAAGDFPVSVFARHVLRQHLRGETPR